MNFYFQTWSDFADNAHLCKLVYIFSKNLTFEWRIRFNFRLFYYIPNPFSLVYHYLSIFDSLALIKVLPLLFGILYLGPWFILCKYLFLLIPFSNSIGHMYYVCATSCIDSRIKFCLLAFYCPKSLPARPTECQTVNIFGHITNSVPGENATALLNYCGDRINY